MDRTKVAITTVAVLGCAGFFALTSGEKQHYKKVHQLGDLAKWGDKEVMVHGNVVPGSIRESVIDQETQRTFMVESGGARIRVLHAGPKPDTFKDLSEVVAIGHIVPSGPKQPIASALHVVLDAPYVVDATELRAKCPTRYTGAQANRDLNKPIPY
jgi:cytochrome c-type biogenesis protein CcmE